MSDYDPRPHPLAEEDGRWDEYQLKIIRNRLDMVYRALDNSSDFATKDFIRRMVGSAAVVLESELGMREVEREIEQFKAEKGVA